MGKEAKIGLAIIGTLLITFGVVLVKRLGKTDEGDQTTAAKDAKTTASGSTAGGTSTFDGVAGQPKTLDTTALSGQTPTYSSGTPKQWTGAGTATASPPSYVPNPPVPASIDPYDRYGSTPLSTSTLPAGSPSTNNVAQETQQPYNPYRSQSPTSSGTAGQSAGGLRVVPAPGSSFMGGSSAASSGNYGANSTYGSGSYTPGSASASSVPAYSQRSPYGYSSATPAPLTARQYGASVGQYGASSGLSAAGSQFDMGGVQGANGEYEIQPNDSYWIISKNVYGTGAYFKALAEHNRGKFPKENRLEVGEMIATPNVADLAESYPGLCPSLDRHAILRKQALAVSTQNTFATGPSYVVEDGDTLFDIARYELGKASRWGEIYQLNRNLLGNDYNYLVPGTRLTLPDAGNPADAITRHPDSGSVYQR